MHKSVPDPANGTSALLVLLADACGSSLIRRGWRIQKSEKQMDQNQESNIFSRCHQAA